MRATDAFPTEREQQAFKQRLPRTLRELTMRERKQERRTAIDAAVTDAAKSLKGKHRTRVAVIVSVAERDGLTYAAVAAGEAARAADRDLKSVSVGPDRRPDDLPMVATLIGENEVRRHARRSGVVRGRGPRQRRLTAAAVVVALLLGAASFAVGLTVSAAAGPAKVLLVGLCVAGMGFAGNLLVERARGRNQPERPLREALEDAADNAKDAYTRWIQACVASLAAGPSPRAVVIAGFGRLDPASKEVVYAYLHDHRPARERELWIVLDSAPPLAPARPPLQGELTRRLMQSLPWLRANRSDESGDRRVTCLVQEPLSEEHRAELAASIGDPRRAALLAVSDIARPSLDFEEALLRRCGEHRTAHPRSSGESGPLDLLYLLALRYDDAPIGREKLASDFSSAMVRTEVLAVVLGAAPTRRDIQRWYDDIRIEFGMALEPGPGALKLTAEARSFFANRREDLELPDARLGHLFWALHTDDRMGEKVIPDQLVMLRRHLLDIDDISLADDLGERVAVRTFDAFLSAVEGSIKVSYPDDVNTLLEYAEACVEARPDDGRRHRLSSLAGVAYALLGDERILGVLLHTRTAAAATDTVPPAEKVFVESLSFESDAQEWRQELMAKLRALDPGIRGYAHVRAVWLAQLFAGESRWSDHLLTRLSMSGDAELRAVVQDALERVQSGQRKLVAADAMTVAIGVWSCSVAFRDAARDDEDGLAERLRADVALLEDAYVPADDLSKGLLSTSSYADYDLSRDCIAQELTVTIGASAYLIAQVARDVAPPGSPLRAELEEQLDKLDALVRWAAADESHPARNVLARNLNLVRFAWQRLGLTQMATLVGLRWGHFYLLTGDVAEEDTLHAALEGMLELTDANGVTGLMANAIAALGAEDREASAAQLLCRGIDLAADRLGSDLVTDLCLTGVAMAHNHEKVDLTAQLERLLAVDEASGERRLGRRLRTIADGELANTTLFLLNAVADRARPELAAAVPRELSARAANIADEHTRAKVTEQIELFDVERELRESDEEIVPRIVAEWEGRERWESFARVLLRLLGRFGARDDLLDAGTDLLAAHPGSPGWNTPVSLAHWIASESRSGSGRAAERLAITVEYLEAAMPAWERSYEPEFNIGVYRLLASETMRKPEYLQRVITWQERQQEQFALSNLRALLRQGLHFEIFWHYFRTLDYLGLVPDPYYSRAEIVGLAEPAQNAILRKWRRAPTEAPPPMSANGHGPAVNGDFLKRGYWLFHAGGDEPALAPARKHVNGAARVSIHALYDHIAGLQTIPEGVRRILEAHRDQFRRPVR
jgi:hypothetical protein